MNHLNSSIQLRWSEYPVTIPKFEIRLDAHSGVAVRRGAILNILKSEEIISLSDFYKTLQCPVYEPDLDYQAGTYSMMRMIPPTRELVELMCAYREHPDISNYRNIRPWHEVKKTLKELRQNIDSDISLDQWLLYRIIDGELYYDWPWRRNRADNDYNMWKFRSLYPVLSKLKDLQDSVFFVGYENPFLPFNFPFPMFSFPPRMGTSDIPWPWFANINEESDAYTNIMNDHAGNFSMYWQRVDQKNWHDRIPKATFFASWDVPRQIVFDVARLYPDLIEMEHGGAYCRPWNPLSNETWNEELPLSKCRNKTTPKSPPGYCANLLQECDYIAPSQNMEDYKYVIVPMGAEGNTLSSRLATLLSHSGSVILYPTNDFVYHFSSRLKPWVHYVPISYSMADVSDKLLWLQKHDRLARQIARNGRRFADSHLRLEDYFCYSVRALDELAKIQNGTDALEPFDAKKLTKGLKTNQYGLLV